jgi:hypothetical protein
MDTAAPAPETTTANRANDGAGIATEPGSTLPARRYKPYVTFKRGVTTANVINALAVMPMSLAAATGLIGHDGWIAPIVEFVKQVRN